MIELRAGALRCELVPELGGAIAGLWLDGVAVLQSTPMPQLSSARQAGCHPLVPYSNRVGQAAIVWQGTLQPQVRHPGDAPRAIHGMAWQRPWEVLEADATSAMLAFGHPADSVWPFAFDCSHTLRLQPDALELTLAVTNQSGKAAPLGLGWRTLLARRPGARIALRAGGRWEFDADRHPVLRHASTGLDADGALPLQDTCFDNWDGLLTLRDGALQVRVRSELSRIVVADDGAPGALLVEPVSHVPNAVHRYATGAPAADLGLAILQPGESLVAQMRIEAEPAA